MDIQVNDCVQYVAHFLTEKRAIEDLDGFTLHTGERLIITKACMAINISIEDDRKVINFSILPSHKILFTCKLKNGNIFYFKRISNNYYKYWTLKDGNEVLPPTRTSYKNMRAYFHFWLKSLS